MAIWRVRIASWIPEATNIHSEYVIRIAFPLQRKLHENASILCYTQSACLVYSMYPPTQYIINSLNQKQRSICCRKVNK